MHQRILTQISESPYRPVRGFSRKSQEKPQIGRRIVTENEQELKTPLANQHNYFPKNNYLRKPFIRKATLGTPSSNDMKFMIGIQSVKADKTNTINNYNNININISNCLETNSKYFPNLKSTSKTPLSKKSKERPQNLSMHENILNDNPKRKLKTTESYEADAQDMQNIIIASIREKKDLYHKDTKKLKVPVKPQKPIILDQSIDVVESQKNIKVPIKQKQLFEHTKMKSQSYHQQRSYSNHSQTPSHQAKSSEKSLIQARDRQSSVESHKNAKDLQAEVLIQAPQPKRVHPKVHWDMSDEEWNMFGDRFPIQFDKKKLLGRGGFSLVWLGEHRKTKERVAIKQILSNNTHQSHMKEIWFGTYFFENGECKSKFQKNIGCKNLVRFLGYDVKPQDTWIFYEICGESLGNHLYDLRGENMAQERVYRIYHRSLYQTLRKDNGELKILIKQLAAALDILQEQRIVHSDLKTENILIKTEKNASGIYSITDIKLIDYGSSFPFDDLKQFSMATPEYMCPEILNYILYENSLSYNQALLKYLQKYKRPWVIDIWSLGCVALEIVSGIPLWMSLKTIVSLKGKDQVEYGLFAVKGRVFEKIIERQVEVVSNLDYYLDNQCFSGIKVDNDLRYLLKRMLSLDPEKRISPKEVLDYLEPKGQHLITQ